MTTAAISARAQATPAPSGAPREWWQVLAERRARWAAAHPRLRAVWRRVRTIMLWAGLLYVAGLWVFMPDLRLGMQAYVGCLWIVIAWFCLTRTKTLTWGGFMRFFATCIPWSIGIGVLSRHLAVQLAEYDLIGAGHVGSSVAIAGIAEEAGKLLPVLLIALLAPRRAARFATADWLLLGLASGTAFLAVEEALRRTAYVTGTGGMDLLNKALYGDSLPGDWVKFSWVPIPSGYGNADTGPSLSLVTTDAAFGGHAIMTALVTGTAGLALAAWQTRRGALGGPERSLSGRIVGGLALAVVTIGVFWSVITDHAMFNASLRITTAMTTDDGAPAWLDPATSTIPWWLREPWTLLGEGHGRTGVFIGLVVICILVDAARQATPAASLTGRAFGPMMTLGRATARAGALTRPLLAVVHATVALLWITVRDLAQAAAGSSRQPGEARRAAIARGAATVTGQRALRELAHEHAHGRIHPWVRRLTVTAAAGGLVWMILVLAPDTAERIGSDVTDVEQLVFGDPWLAGVLDDIADWWNSQPLAVQILIGIGIAAIIAASGGSLALAFGISGVITWGLDHSAGLADLTRNPRQATRNYFATATPGQIAADTIGTALTFAPGNFAGAAGGRVARGVVDDLLADPGAWLTARRQRFRDADLADDTGHIGVPGTPRTVLDDAWATWNTPRNLEHVIDPAKHGFDDMVQRAGGREKTLRAILNSLEGATDLPERGVFEVNRTVFGETVTIRGAMVNGTPRLGTAFIPAKFGK